MYAVLILVKSLGGLTIALTKLSSIPINEGKCLIPSYTPPKQVIEINIYNMVKNTPAALIFFADTLLTSI